MARRHARVAKERLIHQKLPPPLPPVGGTGGGGPVTGTGGKNRSPNSDSNATLSNAVGASGSSKIGGASPAAVPQTMLSHSGAPSHAVPHTMLSHSGAPLHAAPHTTLSPSAPPMPAVPPPRWP